MGNKDLVGAARTNNYWLCLKSPRNERVLKALAKVDRAEFLPYFSFNYAYSDEPVSIGCDATCSMPSLVALMADMLELKAGLTVLEIGTGCGYSAALTAHLIKPGKLTTVEIVPELAEMGKRHLEHHFGALEGKIQVVEGDGSVGFKENAPYDRIYLTAAPDIRTFKPEKLLSQLATPGILLFPETTTHALYLYKKTKTGTKIEPFFGVAFVPLQGKNC
jgi:protein-L-isoaspartate(D-aspartate) O-methyltransferase